MDFRQEGRQDMTGGNVGVREGAWQRVRQRPDRGMAGLSKAGAEAASAGNPGRKA